MTTTSGRSRTSISWLAHWPRWIGYLAGVWSLAYGLLSL
jgi:hypothetical protein